MVIIQNGWSEPFKVMGAPIWNESLAYKESIYNYKIRVDGGWLYYNSYSKAIIFLELTETFEPNEPLVMFGFFVDSSVDEYQRTLKFKEEYRNSHRQAYENPESYIIFMTMGCNARCSYCFEKDYNHQLNMSPSRALDVAKYILKTAKHDFKIVWFGGEPLTNTKAINIISQYLNKNSKYQWHSSIVTNGYLIKDIDTDTMKYTWHIGSMQVTLDGIYDDYDNVKQLSERKDGFQTVIDSIQKCADNGIHVDIRLNVGLDNFDQLADVVKYINTYFWWYENIVLYAHPIYKDRVNDWTDEETKIIYSNYQKLTEMIGLTALGQRNNHTGTNWSSWKFFNCMADSHASLCITPVGNLTTCEHDVEDNIIGNIYSDKFNEDVYKKFEIMRDELPWCVDCKYKPMCALTKECPGMPRCTPQLKEIYNKQIIDNMHQWWRDWLLRQNEDEKEESENGNRI